MALSSSKQRTYRATTHDMVLVLPIKSGATIYEGAALESNGGYIEPASGAGTFMGFAMQDGVGGATDGLNSIQVRVAGLVELPITTDTPAQSNVGVTATVVEATDDDTFRIETGATITGTLIGKITGLVSATVVLVSFKAAMVA
jgi:hypothetical protein